MAKRPAFQFYPGDWLRDTALRSCSVGARGLWIDMLCLMHEGTPYGYLKVGAKVILPAKLAEMVGAKKSEIKAWLFELSEANVYSVADDGCMYSRRMVKDEQTRAARAAGGKLGGNPALKGSAKVEDKDNLQANLEPTPSSSSSSSSSDQLPAATVIMRAWWPRFETKKDLEMIHGYAEQWIDEQVPSFVAYWLDRNEPRTSFDALFIDHCKNRATLRSAS